jgi:hypothetical protein
MVDNADYSFKMQTRRKLDVPRRRDYKGHRELWPHIGRDHTTEMAGAMDSPMSRGYAKLRREEKQHEGS